MRVQNKATPEMAGIGDNTRILKGEYGIDTVAAREECLRLVQPLPRDRVLDVGTGSGWMAIVLARNGYDVTSVDLDEDAIGSARERAEAEGAVNLLHEVPQELGDFGVMIFGGLSRSRALLYNLLSALTAVLGGGFAYLFSMYVQDLRGVLLPFAAGGFIYIALVDLIPELHKRRKPKEGWLQFGLICLGLAVLWTATLVRHE